MNRPSISKIACSTLLAGALLGSAALPAGAAVSSASTSTASAPASVHAVHKTTHKTTHKVTHKTKKVVKKVTKKKKKAVAKTPVVAKANLTGFEAALLSDINKARAAVGENALVAAPGTTDVARRWSLTLVQNAALSHNPDLPTAAEAAGSNAWTWLGENVGTGPADDEADLFAAYMASPHHRDNILDPRGRYIGIGVIETTDSDGNAIAYNTCDFTDAYTNSYGADKTPALPSVMSAAQLTSALAG